MLFRLCILCIFFTFVSSVDNFILSTIQNNIIDFSHILNGTAMCSVLKYRLSKHGISMGSVSECLSTLVNSEHGSTLGSVYSKLERCSPHYLKLARDIETEKRIQVHKECNIEFMFDHGIRQWSEANAPNIELDPCYANDMMLDNDPSCVPVHNDSSLYGIFETLSFDRCYNAIDELTSQIEKVIEESRLQRELPIELSMEISRLWRYEMPGKLASKAKLIYLRIP